MITNNNKLYKNDLYEKKLEKNISKKKRYIIFSTKEEIELQCVGMPSRFGLSVSSEANICTSDFLSLNLFSNSIVVLVLFCFSSLTELLCSAVALFSRKSIALFSILTHDFVVMSLTCSNGLSFP